MSDRENSYAADTRDLLYSYLICLPLLLAYEVLILISQPDTQQFVRISVDMWFKSVFAFFGLGTISMTLLIAALCGAVIVFYKRDHLRYLKKRYFAYMILESGLYAILTASAIGAFLGTFLNLAADGSLYGIGKLQWIALSLGAGLYEELFFRVILVGLLLYLFRFLFAKKTHASIAAVFLAAILFSVIHYIGDFSDTFTISSFLFRFLFGLALNLIYVTRGFGVAAWTHAIYDLLIVLTF